MKHEQNTMKLTTMSALIGTILCTGSTSAAVIADFTNSVDEASPATAINLNLGTTGGAWSDINVTGEGSITVDTNTLKLGNTANNGGAVSTATLNFAAPQTIAGTMFSFDASLDGFGGQVGRIDFDLFDGATQVLRVSMSPDAGEGRGTLSHWTAVGGTRTGLTAQNEVWSGLGQMVSVQFTLGASDFDLSTTGGAVTDVASTGLDYFAGFSSTTFDSLVITADGNKAAVTLDNISIGSIPEPSSAALLGVCGIALILHRRR